MKKTIISLFMVSLMAGVAYAQTDSPTLGERIDTTVDKIEQGADQAGDSLKDGYDKSKELLKQGAEKVDEAADQAGNKIKETYDSTKDKLLSHENTEEVFVIPGEETFVTTSFINTDVTNDKGEKIGTIKDVVLNDDQVSAVILSVGGFLGMDEHDVAVSPDALTITKDNDTWKVSTHLTKEQLSAAPHYKLK